MNQGFGFCSRFLSLLLGLGCWGSFWESVPRILSWCFGIRFMRLRFGRERNGFFVAAFGFWVVGLRFSVFREKVSRIVSDCDTLHLLMLYCEFGRFWAMFFALDFFRFVCV